MDKDIIAQMRAEEADLARKLKAVRDFLVAYGAPASNDLTRAVTPTPVQKAQAEGRGKVDIDGYSPYGRGIVATAMVVLLTANHPMKTRQIVEVLQSMNVEITGQDPINAVGALISRSTDIISHGKAGWTLADVEKAREIVGKYALKENEPRSDDAGGSDAGTEGASTPYVPSFGRPQPTLHG